MKSINKYLSTKVKSSKIKATDETIKDIVAKEIDRLGPNADLNHIDVSEVTDMDSLFYEINFNGDISKWDVSSVKYMQWMFYESNFNGDISKWDVNNVIDMQMMFKDSEFSGDISKWNVKEIYMRNMFKNCPLEKNPPEWYKKSVWYK